MANNRLVLLSAVALVAIISPILKPIMAADGAADHLSAKDQEALKKLKKNVLPDEQIKNLLSNFENQDFIFFDKIKVRDILAMLDLSVEGCLDRVVFMKHKVFAKVKDPNLAQNLYKFTLKSWIAFCAENIKEAARYIVTESEYKFTCHSLTHLNGLLVTLKGMSAKLSETFSSLVKGDIRREYDMCMQFASFRGEVPEISTNKADSKKYPRTNDIERLTILREVEYLPAKEIEDILNSFEDKDFILFGKVNVRNINDLTILSEPSVAICEQDIGWPRPDVFAKVERLILGENLRRFTLRHLTPFCAQNFVNVFKSIMGEEPEDEPEDEPSCFSLFRAYEFSNEMRIFTGNFIYKKYFSTLVRNGYLKLYKDCMKDEYYAKSLPDI